MTSPREFYESWSPSLPSRPAGGSGFSKQPRRRSAVLHLKGLDEPLGRALDDRGIRVADEDVTIPLVAVRLRRAGCGQLRLDDELAPALVRAGDAERTQHAPATHATQEGAADGVLPLPRSVERLVDHRARPGAVEVSGVC